ncbi:MAG TPA: IclR family transcriptional regulator [Anaerolineae bacterium]|nr:IclR family transcriptional regulator [Anaerolineae bacterium]
MSIQSVSRAFTILRTVASHPDGIGVSAVAKRMNLHKSTVSRLLSTLEAEDAVERSDNGYRISDGLAMLVAPLLLPQNLTELLRPLLVKLTEQTGEASGLAVLDGWNALSTAHVASQHNLQVRDWTGESFPLHIAASGKNFLAFWPHFRREEYLAQPMQAYTPHSITDPAQLRERIFAVRQQGYDWTFDEFEVGLCAVAAPVFDQYRRVVAAIYISGPTFRLPERVRDGVTERLLASVGEGSRMVGKYLVGRVEGGGND